MASKIAFALIPPPVTNSSRQTTNTSVTSALGGIRRAFGTARSGVSSGLSFGAHRATTAGTTALTKFSETSFGNRISTGATSAFKGARSTFETASSGISSRLSPIVQRTIIETIIALKKLSDFGDWISTGATSALGGIRWAIAITFSGTGSGLSFGAHKIATASIAVFSATKHSRLGRAIGLTGIAGVTGMVASTSYLLYAKDQQSRLKAAQQQVPLFSEIVSRAVAAANGGKSIQIIKSSFENNEPSFEDRSNKSWHPVLTLQGASSFGSVGRQLRTLQNAWSATHSAISEFERAVFNASINVTIKHSHPEIQAAQIALEGALNHLKTVTDALCTPNDERRAAVIDSFGKFGYNVPTPNIDRMTVLEDWFIRPPKGRFDIRSAGRVGLTGLVISTVVTVASLVLKARARSHAGLT